MMSSPLPAIKRFSKQQTLAPNLAPQPQLSPIPLIPAAQLGAPPTATVAPSAIGPAPLSPSKKRKSMETGASSSLAAAAAAAPQPTDLGDLGLPAPGAENSADAGGPPSAKKARTNTPWTPAEEKRLKQMRDAGSTWSEIAKTFPNRTEGSVKKHWYKDMHYADFAEDESAALLAAIKEYDANKWKVIGQKVGKPAKACEQYAKENFAGRV